MTLVALCGVTVAGWAESRDGTVQRHPASVHERLRDICESAGYEVKSYRQCAEAIASKCSRAGVSPETAACWQWLVDRDAKGNLNRDSLKLRAPRDRTWSESR